MTFKTTCITALFTSSSQPRAGRKPRQRAMASLATTAGTALATLTPSSALISGAISGTITASILGSTAFAQDAGLIAAHPIAETRPQIIVPQRPWTPSPGDAVPSSVWTSSVDVDVQIVGNLATTTLAIELANPTGRPVEAELVIPVPHGSAIIAFGLDGLGPEPTARLLPREEARRAYSEIVRRMVDPGLLEFAGNGMIRSSVFPVPAGGRETFRVTYEQVLTGHGSRMDYALPRAQNTHASPGHAKADGTTEWDIDVTVRPSPRGAAKPIAAVWSPSHGVTTTLGSTTTIDVTNPNEPGTFRMSILFKSDQSPMTVMAYPDPDADPAAGQGGYFAVLMAAPDLPAGAEPMPREVTVVLDRSGSMREGKLDQAVAAAMQVIGALNDGERFNLIDYANDAQSFAPTPVVKTPETMAALQAYARGIKALGGTNIRDALVAALKPEPTAGHIPMVLFLTDGLATVGETSESGIRDSVATANTHGHRVFTFGVGYDVNAPLLSGLAQTTRATATFVSPEEDIEVKVGDLFDKLQGPVLARPEFTCSPVLADLTGPMVRDVLPSPAALPDVFSGDQVLIVGRYTSAVLSTMSVTGTQLDERLTLSIQFNPGEDAGPGFAFVPRLWAQRQIAALTAQVRQLQAEPSPEPGLLERQKELIDDIIALSQRFGILTEYTAFLAADEDDLRQLADAGSFGQAGIDLVVRAGGRDRVSQQELNRLSYMSTANAPEPGARSGREAVAAEADNMSLAGTVLKSSTAVADSSRIQGRYAAAAPAANTRAAANLKQIAGQSYVQRQNRWIDGRVLEAERRAVVAQAELAAINQAEGKPAPEQITLIDDKPAEDFDRVIEFGTDDYENLLDRFIAEGRPGLLAVRGELVLLLDNQTVLVRNPS